MDEPQDGNQGQEYQEDDFGSIDPGLVPFSNTEGEDALEEGREELEDGS